MAFDPACIRLICFDVDGTLNDTDDQYLKQITPWVKPLALVLQRDPKKLARELVYRLESPGSWAMELLDSLRLDNTANRASELIDRLVTARRPHTYTIITGAREMLAQLQPVYNLAVVSARGRRKTMAFLDYFELTDFFQQIITGQTCERTKPHPDPILWAAQQAGVSPSECLMVGDTSMDIRAGKSAGAQTVGVLCGFGQEDELRQAGADLILLRTPDLILNLNTFSNIITSDEG